jgi:hypothetical protein
VAKEEFLPQRLKKTSGVYMLGPTDYTVQVQEDGSFVIVNNVKDSTQKAGRGFSQNSWTTNESGARI